MSTKSEGPKYFFSSVCVIAVVALVFAGHKDVVGMAALFFFVIIIMRSL